MSDFVTIVPYTKDKDLGTFYNNALRVVGNWVLFVDHDVFLATNSSWYGICSEAINQVKNNAGIITCTTNRIGCSWQRDNNAPKSTCIEEHQKYAIQLYQEKGLGIMDVTRQARTKKLSGFFMLTNKKVWEKTGGFVSGFYGVDNYYGEKVIQAGFRIYLISGLYLYHRYQTTGGKI